MKIAFAHMGNYSLAFKNLLENLGAEVVFYQRTNPRSIEEGAKLSPGLFCFPLKVNIGNYLQAIREGADTILMWENISGSCRLRYYWLIQKKILEDLGFKVEVWNLNFRNIFSQVRRIGRKKDLSFWQILKAFLFFFQEIAFIEELERKTWYFRPREIKKGKTDEVFRKVLEKLENLKTKRELEKLKKETSQLFSQIKIEEREILKVGLVGEIYTLVDSQVNFELEKKLGQLGVEVDRKLNLSQFLKSGIFPWIDWRVQQKIKSYLASTVGGHGRQAIEEMLEYAKAGFDGVIQLLPMSCMPETTVRPILQKISQEKRIPFLSLSLDEQTGEAGIQTRLEAFVDLMKSRRSVGPFHWH